MAHVVVTGANGFVGRATTRVLAARSATVLAVVRSGERSPVASVAVDTAVVGDIAGPVRWSPLMRGADAVVHLAARVHVTRDRGNDAEDAYRRTNVEATVTLARAAADAGVRKFVYVSSVKAVAERSMGPLDEASVPAPEDAYGRSKLAAERALCNIASATGLEVVIVRPPLVYGPGVRGNFARLPGLVKLATWLPLPLDTPNRRSLVFVDNLADALATVVLHRGPSAGTFFVRDGVDLSTADLLRRLGRAMNARPRFTPAPARAMQVVARAIGCAGVVDRLLGSLQVDDSPLRSRFAWRPPVQVDDAIRVTAAAHCVT